tara:strand:- start:821 stop:1678 length:858 start_codon:yes stop_codon:yes gene_type:complete
MVNKLLKIFLSALIIFVLHSCSLAGSWVYERIDNYISDYFKDFASFSAEQNREIESISEDFLDWFTLNELPKIKVILEDLKKIDLGNSSNVIENTYEKGEKIVNGINDYFEKPIIDFSKGLSEEQIAQIGLHFEKLRKEREDRRSKEKKEYKERILDNYKSGFDRLGIKLNKDQLNLIETKLQNYNEIRKEWSDLQKSWIDEFLRILSTNRSDGYDERMTLYLRSLQDLGNEEFREKIEKNETLSLEILESVLLTIDEKQLRSFNRSLDVYLKSINRILANRKVN